MMTAQRSQRQALDALAFGIGKRRINRVLDCDIQSFFDKVSREWLIPIWQISIEPPGVKQSFPGVSARATSLRTSAHPSRSLLVTPGDSLEAAWPVRTNLRQHQQDLLFPCIASSFLQR